MADYILNFGNMNDGKVLEALDDSIKKIVANILDPNTDPEQKRKIKCTISFEPSADRAYVLVQAKVEPTLAAVPASTGAIHINCGDNQAYVRDPRQDELFTSTVKIGTQKQ